MLDTSVLADHTLTNTYVHINMPYIQHVYIRRSKHALYHIYIYIYGSHQLVFYFIETIFLVENFDKFLI